MSKDINLRIKATIVGVYTEDYFNDKTLDDADLLYTGATALPEDFWDSHSQSMDSWQEQGRTFYRVQGPLTKDWSTNEFLFTEDGSNFEAVVRESDEETRSSSWSRITTATKLGLGHHRAQPGAEFRAQSADGRRVDFVSILGPAGTGKTLLALAAGLAQTLDVNRFREIIMTRVTVPLGEDIGFLPGTEEEKMEPWMGALMDNLEVLTQSDEGGDGAAPRPGSAASRIKIRSLNFMRGRTFLNRFIILDEAQNLTLEADEGADHAGRPRHQGGLPGQCGPDRHALSDRNHLRADLCREPLPDWPHSGHITLMRGERSRLADHASVIL